MFIKISNTLHFARWAQRSIRKKFFRKIMLLKILKRTDKPFKGDEGTMIPYFWYRAEKENGTTIQFGSTNAGHEIGQKKEIVIEENSNGRFVEARE